jgi:hypothetical protein
MAQTKTQTRSRGKPKAGGSSNGKARTAKPKKAKPKKAASSSKPRTNSGRKASSSKPSSSKPKSKAGPSSKPKGLVDKTKAAGESVEETAKDAGRTVGRAASKAKVPLMAGGAALAGAAAAGGLALNARGKRHGVLGGRPKVKVKVKPKDLAKAAKKAGDVGAQVGEIALEVRRARESTANGKVHRSPIEVVLQGLTSRGPRE